MVHLFINRVHLFNIDPNIDYILMLVEQYHEGNCEDKEILTSIRKAVDASMQLRSKKELIEAFINRVNVDTTRRNQKICVQCVPRWSIENDWNRN